MFELSVAWKYLSPRWRQLSVSIISLISICVIALVVWLIVVFFSVTHGLEKGWIQKLIALTAPVRIIPTDAYYRSYYYQVDSISSASDYALKSIGEKLQSQASDPYDSTIDGEPPSSWPSPDVETDGSVKDLVKTAYQIASTLPNTPGLSVKDFELAVSNLRLQLTRNSAQASTPAYLSQAAYIGSLDPKNSSLTDTLQPITPDDIDNVLNLLVQDPSSDFSTNLQNLFQHLEITELKTPEAGWVLPKSLWPQDATFRACLVMKDQLVTQVIIPQNENLIDELQADLNEKGFVTTVDEITITNGTLATEKLPIHPHIPLVIQGGIFLPAKLEAESLQVATHPTGLLFAVNFNMQGYQFIGTTPFTNLQVGKVNVKTQFSEQPANPPLWISQIMESDGHIQLSLPSNSFSGEGVLLPKGFRDAGVLLGDKGHLLYYAATASSVQEQQLPIYVAGFYDPGIIPIGGKYLIANDQVISIVRNSQNMDNHFLSNGINVRFDNLDQAAQIKDALQTAFKKKGISPYWKVETYDEYEFTKDLIQQLRSERTLWTLIATVIIIVACSNIISMLIILVNDKKVEIGILRSMGASSMSIAAIFGICGIVMGAIGSVIGSFIAILTLKNLHGLMDLISVLQGHEMFNPVFYGKILPNEISTEALVFVIIATAVISLLAGVIPAIKASKLNLSSVLRSE